MRLRKDLIARKLGMYPEGDEWRERRLCPVCGRAAAVPAQEAGSREAMFDDETMRYTTRFLWQCSGCRCLWWHVYCEDDGPGIQGVQRAD